MPNACGRLGLEGEAGVVELQLLEGVAQVGQLVAVDRVEPAEDHRLGVLIAGEGLGGAVHGGGHRLTRAGLADVFDPGDEVADLSGAEHLHRDSYRRAHAHLLHVMHGVGLHEAETGIGVQRAVDDPDGTHDASILVVRRVEDERPQGRLRVAHRRGDPVDDRLEELGHTRPGLGGDLQHLFGRQPEDVLDLEGAALGIRRREVDLVEHRDDLEIVLHGLVAVGQGLRLNALRGIHQEDRALAGGQRPAHLVAEVDVAGSVDEVQHMAVVEDPDVLGLDGDAPFPLDVHGIEVLLAHLPGIHRARDLENAVRQRRLAVVDMADDREIADIAQSDGTTGGERE